MSWQNVALIAICVFGGIAFLGLIAWAVVAVRVFRSTGRKDGW